MIAAHVTGCVRTMQPHYLNAIRYVLKVKFLPSPVSVKTANVNGWMSQLTIVRKGIRVHLTTILAVAVGRALVAMKTPLNAINFARLK